MTMAACMELPDGDLGSRLMSAWGKSISKLLQCLVLVWSEAGVNYHFTTKTPGLASPLTSHGTTSTFFMPIFRCVLGQVIYYHKQVRVAGERFID